MSKMSFEIMGGVSVIGLDNPPLYRLGLEPRFGATMRKRV
jgi:hypothetical protein